MSFLETPDTPFWRFVSVVGLLWIMICIFFPVIFALAVWGFILALGGLTTGGIAAIVRGLFD